MTNSSSLRPRSRSAIVVLGMHRSGTSVLSRALITLGVDFGESFVDAEQDNPKGFFEDKEINALNVSFLKSQGLHWHTLNIPKHFPSLVIDEFKPKAEELLKQKFFESPLWGLKEPRITRLLPLWEDAIRSNGSKPRYILANRNPLSVADSLAKRDNIPRSHALALWALHQIEGTEAIINHRGIVVDYDLMVTQPELQLARLADFIEVTAELEKKRIFLNEFLDPNLRHSHYVKPSQSVTLLTTACLDFHRDLTALSAHKGPIDQHVAALAESSLSRMKASLEVHSEWFTSIDALQSNVDRIKRELKTAESHIARLEAKIAHFDNTYSSRLYRRFKRILGD